MIELTKGQNARTATGIAVAALLLLPIPGSAQCCGDCNGDGRVTIDEILKTVYNALENCAGAVSTPIGSSTRSPTPAPTPTALPDQCATDPPGTRFTVLGTNYVVVEFEVILENSLQTYLLRSPVALDASGYLTNLQNPIYLQQTCGQVQSCASGLGRHPGSICGFPALFADTGNFTGAFRGGASTSYSETGAAAEWNYTVSALPQALITVDATHEPLYLYFPNSNIPAKTVSVPELSTHGYSFASANYPEPSSTDLAQLLGQLSSIYTHISIRPAPLPTPPAFPLVSP